MPRPTRARLTGLDRLEAREVPATLAPLADLTTRGADAFVSVPYPYNGLTSGVTAGGTTYFVATAAAGPGLFRTDGTPAGTTLVKDLTPPSGQSIGLPLLAAAGNRVVFTHTDAAGGNEPWVTDGTVAGTKRLADLTPGAAGTYFTGLTSVGGRALLGTAGPIGPPALWSTDGTAAGTVKLTTLSYGYLTTGGAAVGGSLLFAAGRSDAAGQFVTDLIVTDGTPAGTRKRVSLSANTTVTSAYDGTSWAAAAADGTVVFGASDGTAGAEPWAVTADGKVARLLDLNTTGGLPTPDLPLPNNGSNPGQFAALNGRVYFAADDGSHGIELWSTDGTAAGTRLVVDLSPAVGSVDPTSPGTIDPVTGVWRPAVNGSVIRNLTAAGGRLYFAADDGTGAGSQLYVSDGTAAGTVRLTAVDQPTATPFFDPAPKVVGTAGGTVLFTAPAGDLGLQLWATDGTPAGTAMLPAVGSGAPNTYGYNSGPLPVAAAPGKLYFSADDGVAGRQLWATDGTAAGTKRAAVVNTATVGSNPRLFTAAGKRGLFVAQTADGTQTGLYATDAAFAPVLLTSTAEGISQLVATAAGKAFAVTGYGVFGSKLIVTDGTPAGTTTLLAQESAPVTPPFPGGPMTAAPGVSNVTAVGSRVFFTLAASPGVVDLWKSDGTAAGTVKVATVRDAAPTSDWNWNPPVRQLTAVGDKLYFAVNGGTDDDVVWVSDGTAAGTRRVKDGGANGQAPDGLTALGGKLYYTATSGDAGRQLWVTDGTAAGTKQAATINTGARKDDTVQPLYGATRTTLAAGAKLYLSMANDTDGRQLGVYDPAKGTVARLTRTGDVVWSPTGPGPAEAQVQGLTAADGKVYFTAATVTGSRQVFVTDGTAAGTRVVKEFAAGANGVSLPGGGGPDILAAVGGQVLIAADDGASGRELWVTDGTTAGTKRAKEFAPGGAHGLPYSWEPGASAVVVNNTLLLAANAPATGTEPWAVPLGEVVTAAVPPTVPPSVPPPPAPAPTPAAVVRTFTVLGTLRDTFNGNLATVTLPEASGYTATVDWGDGKPAAAAVTRTTPTGKTWTVAAEHKLALAGDRTLAVTISRGGKTVLTFGVDARVAEFKFYAIRVAQRVTAGQSFNGAVATVNDLNQGLTAADLKATINWGDGTTGVGTLMRSTTGKLEVVGTHTFAVAGSRTVTATVTTVGGNRVETAASSFTVAPPTKPATPPPPREAKFYAIRVAQRVSVGSPFRGAVAVIDDLGQGLTGTDLTATIKWGDGTTSTGTLARNAGGRLEVIGEHTFKAAGKPVVSVTVTGAGGKRVQTADSLFTVDAVKPRR